MKNRFYLFLFVIFVVAMLLFGISACGFSQKAIENTSDEIVFVDASGNELFKISGEDLANTVKTYEGIGGTENVYSWNCVVTGADGSQEVTILQDGKPNVDTIQSILNQGIKRIEIYPASYYTLLTCGIDSYKAVVGQIPTAIPPANKAYCVFEGYYALIDGAEVRLTDASGDFFVKWGYSMYALELIPHYTKQEIAVRIDYNGSEYTAADEAAKLGTLKETVAAPDTLYIGDSLKFLTVLSREGFSFAGWYSGNYEVADAGLSFKHNTDVLTEDFDIKNDESGAPYVTLTAHWIREEYELFFRKFVDGVLDDATPIPSRKEKYGTLIPFDEIQSQLRYCGIAWTDENGNTYDSGDIVPAHSLTLLANIDSHKKIVLEGSEVKVSFLEECETAVCCICQKEIRASKVHAYDREYRPCLDRRCIRCGYIEINDEPHRYEKDARCIDCVCLVCDEVRAASIDHVFDEDSFPALICKLCGRDLLADRGYYRKENSTEVYFGSYPAFLLNENDPEDKAILKTLSALDLKTPGIDPTGWTAFDFGETEGVANVWYRDVSLEKETYRALYVHNQYRLGGHQEENGVETVSLYWFKYANIVWQVVSERDCSATLLADVILDCGDAAYAKIWLASFVSGLGENCRNYVLEDAALLPDTAGRIEYTDYARYLGLSVSDARKAEYLADSDQESGVCKGIRPMIRINFFPEANRSVTLLKGEGIERIVYSIGMNDEEAVLNVSYSLELQEDQSQVTYRGEAAYGYETDRHKYARTITSANNTIEFTATPVTVTITFDAAGGQGGPQSLKGIFDEPLADIEIPTKEHYHFLGYYVISKATGREVMVYDEQGRFVKNAGSDVQFASGEIVRGTYSKDGVLKMGSDFSLIAKWSDVVCIVKYDANGGSGYMTPTSCAYRTPTALSGNTFVKKGYHFGGWLTEATGAQAVFADRESVKELSETDGAELILYALWIANAYEIEYCPNGKDEPTMARTAHIYDTVGTLSKNLYTRKGYVFAGWSDSANATKVKYEDQASVLNLTEGENAVAKLFAVWIPISYTIIYRANGGEGEMTASTFIYDQETPLNENAFTSENFDFCGWAYEPDASVPTFADCEPVSDLASEEGAEVVLYAMWCSKYDYRLEEGAGESYYSVVGVAEDAMLTSVVIPVKHKGLYVRAIAENAFRNSTSLTTVFIPSSVTSIGEGAFSGCSALTSITIPFVGNRVGVTERDTEQYPFGYIFGTMKYDGGRATAQNYYGRSTTSRTSATYYLPTSLHSVTVLNGYVPFGAFADCADLTSVTIGGTTTKIGEAAFKQCTNLSEVTLPASLTDVSKFLFNECGSLSSITIPASVKTISAYAFAECANLKEILFGGNNLTAIEEKAFYGCIALKTLLLPAGLLKIGAGAFASCKGLESVTIPTSLTDLASNAFHDCDLCTFNGAYYLRHFANCPNSQAKVIGELIDRIYLPGQNYRISSEELTCAGWSFEGWATAANGKVVFGKQQAITDMDIATNGVVNLYAVWKVIPTEVGKYVETKSVVADTDGENVYTVYNTIDSTPWSLADYAIVDWRNEKNTDVYSHNNRVVNDKRYNNIDIGRNTKTVYFIGNEDQTFTDFHFHLVNFTSKDWLNVIFVDFSYITASDGAIKTWWSADHEDKNANLRLTVIGKCSIESSYPSGNLIYKMKETIIDGSGYLTMIAGKGADGSDGKGVKIGNNDYNYTAGNGSNGGNGGIAIQCDGLTITGTGIIEILGGAGGKGGAGGSVSGWSNSDGQPKLPAGGAGGNGGNGGYPLVTNALTIRTGARVILRAGDGGDGGAGGSGGNAYEKAEVRPDNGGNGGNGGKGGDGNKGGKGGEGGEGGHSFGARGGFGDWSAYKGTSGNGGNAGKGGDAISGFSFSNGSNRALDGTVGEAGTIGSAGTTDDTPGAVSGYRGDDGARANDGSKNTAYYDGLVAVLTVETLVS